MLTETFATSELHIQGFYSFNVLAKKVSSGRGRPSGGISILCRPWLSPKLISCSDFHVAVKTTQTSLICFYFQPDTVLEDILHHISDAVSTVDISQPLILGGDFNCRLDNGERGDELTDFLRINYQLELQSSHHEPTYHCWNGSSVIDLIFSNFNTATTVVRNAWTKHSQILSHWQPRQVSQTVKGQPTKRLSRKIDLQRLSNELQQNVREANNVNRMSDQITNAIIASTRSVRKRGQDHKPWFDGNCKAAKRRALELLRCNDPDVQQMAQTARRHYKSIVRKARKEYFDKAIEEKIEKAECTPWTLFKDWTPRRPAPIDTETWLQHFRKVWDPAGPPNITLPDDHDPSSREENAWYNDEFSEIEVQRVLNRLKRKKAPGSDQIANEHLTRGSAVLTPVLTRLFNRCLSEGTIPETWRISRILTLYKGKGALTSPDNYRGIALLQTQYKVLTSLLNKRILKHLEENDLLPEQQYGFRKGRSTHQPIEALLKAATESTSQARGHLYACFVDFRKAFPSVDREVMVRKLPSMGIKGKILSLFASILTYNYVELDDGLKILPAFKQHLGLPEGDTLSPTAFIAFTSDLATQLNSVKDLKFLIYADDLVMYAKDLSAIQQGLNALDNWCNMNKANVNTAKTKMLKFRKGGRLKSSDRVLYRGEHLEFVNSYTYLGVLFQTKPTCFRKHIQSKKRMAVSAIGALKDLQITSLRTAFKIWDMKIRPMIEYSLGALTPYLRLCHMRELDKAKAKFFKRALGVHDSASSSLVLQLSGMNTHCVDMKNRGFSFEESEWVKYTAEREDKFDKLVAENYTSGPAFQDSRWQNAHEKDRNVVVRTTCHGFHHLLCQDACYQPTAMSEDSSCICKICRAEKITRYHILACHGLRGGLSASVRFLESQR